MKLRLVLASLSVLSVVAVTVTLAACRDTPGIDGASVPKIGSATAPPTCAQVCDRLAALCGYAPDDCAARCAEESDEGARVCRGQASSCQEALADCVPATPDAGDADGGEADASAPEDASAADASDDGS